MKQLNEAWLKSPQTTSVMNALGREAFFVGGCVRNSLIGAPVSDIDLATPLTPVEVTRLVEAAGLKAAPTGIDHGTVTVVAGDVAFEVTTFRRDVETDGRRAVVAFSTDIAEDAARRDFTMNALYATAEGEIVDPLGGLPDLEARRVRFILDPEQRIREDALRILRFFRFSAWYGEGIEPEGLAACAAHGALVGSLARERVGAEMLKLLAAPDPAPAVSAMDACGVLARVLPGAKPLALAPLIAREREARVPPNPSIRLAALAADEIDLRLSKKIEREVKEIRSIVEDQLSPARAGADFDEKRAIAGHLILSALMPDPWADIAAEIEMGANAVFPIAAPDLIAAGIPFGPELGRALERARQIWIESRFSIGKDELLERLRE
ncbi:MAG: CCA tRNA nucleotidyltransferase [Pseudomonadota bacterium]